MIERAIENWLINTNERNYHIAFCEVLLHKGHRILYISPHRSMEQGKDIITIDMNGDYCAYQLKTGNIDLKVWRSIVGEVKELIELPIVHPSIDKLVVHKSYLVTNGEVTDEVRIQIDQINDDNIRKSRGYSYLDIITCHSLLKDFVDAQGEFIPNNLDELKTFLELFLSNGCSLIDKEKFFNFFENAVFKQSFKRRSDILNAVYSSVVLCSYILKEYEDKNNYYAMFEAWVIVLACIIKYTTINEIDKNDWIQTYDLIMSEISINIEALKAEVFQKDDFIEGDLCGDGSIIYRARATLVLGIICSYELYKKNNEKDYCFDEKFISLLEQCVLEKTGDNPLLFFWGESAFPFFYSIIKYLELNNKIMIAFQLIIAILVAILENNAPRKDVGTIPNLYYGVSEVLESLSGIINDPIDYSQFSGSSCILETLVQMLARRDLRKIVEIKWRTISHMLINYFVPDNIVDTFSWRSEKGVNYTKFLNETQSWSELKQLSLDTSNINKFLINYKDFLHYFILVCPHRISNDILKLLDVNLEL